MVAIARMTKSLSGYAIANPTFTFSLAVFSAAFITVSSVAIGDTAGIAGRRIIIDSVESNRVVSIRFSVCQVGIVVAGGCGSGNLDIVAEDLVAGDGDVIRSWLPANKDFLTL